MVNITNLHKIIMIKSISDIQIGKQYLLLLSTSKRRPRTCIVKSIFNDPQFENVKKTEILVDIYKKDKWERTNLYFMAEIGIGNTVNEAHENYGKFKYEETCPKKIYDNLRQFMESK